MLMQNFATSITYKALPRDVLPVLRPSILDTLGVVAIGSQSEMAQIVTKTVITVFGTNPTSLARYLFEGTLASAAGATMAGSMTIDSVDAHNGRSPCKGHAGSAIFPALFALADGRGMTRQDVATYLALAYEISYGAGLTQHDTCTDYHTSGAWTTVGVAAISARLLGCDPDQIHEAVGIGEYHGPRNQMMRCIDHPTMARDGVGCGAPAPTCRGPHRADLGERVETCHGYLLKTLSLPPLVTS